MDQEIQDYLFDLQGYLVLENAISKDDLKEMNTWIDAHWEYIENPWAGRNRGTNELHVGSETSKRIPTTSRTG